MPEVDPYGDQLEDTRASSIPSPDDGDQPAEVVLPEPSGDLADA